MCSGVGKSGSPRLKIEDLDALGLHLPPGRPAAIVAEAIFVTSLEMAIGFASFGHQKIARLEKQLIKQAGQGNFGCEVL